MNFEAGDRVELVKTSDPHTYLAPGDHGTVTGTAFIESPIGPERQVHVDWDGGSTLSMILGEDQIRHVEEDA